MRQFARFVTAIAVGVTLVAAGTAPSSAQKDTAAGAATTQTTHKHAAIRKYAFDGLWSVSIFTQAGPCDASYRYPARIVRGQVLQADDDLSYQLVGAVGGTGMIVVTVSKGGQNATGRGWLRAATGSGQWSTEGGQCSGVWNAVRRKLEAGVS